MLKKIIIIIFIIGVVIVVREMTKLSYQCQKKEIIYKYLPRDLDMDLEDSKDINLIFSTMFQKAEPWVGSVRNNETENILRKIKL